MIVAGLGNVGFRIVQELGRAQIERRVLEYGATLTSALESRGHRVVSSRREGERSGIISMAGDRLDPVALQRKLTDARVACAVRAGRVRLAYHFYNDDSDLERLLECLP